MKPFRLSARDKKKPVGVGYVRDITDSTLSEERDKSLVRFFSKFVKTHDNMCWNWRGTKDRDGYGKFMDYWGIQSAHRYSYKYFVGEIPTNMVIDHLCTNPSCVNPTHLDVTDIYDNSIRRTRERGLAKKRRHLDIGDTCRQGLHTILTTKDYVVSYNGKYKYHKCAGCRKLSRQRSRLRKKR